MWRHTEGGGGCACHTYIAGVDVDILTYARGCGCPPSIIMTICVSSFALELQLKLKTFVSSLLYATCCNFHGETGQLKYLCVHIRTHTHTGTNTKVKAQHAQAQAQWANKFECFTLPACFIVALLLRCCCVEGCVRACVCLCVCVLVCAPTMHRSSVSK